MKSTIVQGFKTTTKNNTTIIKIIKFCKFIKKKHQIKNFTAFLFAIKLNFF